MKYGFIYIWFDKKRKMYYVGSHWGEENDGYICSSNRMRDAYNRRPFDFKRRVLKKVYTNRLDLLNEEQRYLNMIKKEQTGKQYYNICLITKNPWWIGGTSKKSISEKLSVAITNKIQTDPEYKEKILTALEKAREKLMTPKIQQKRFETLRTPEAKKANSERGIIQFQDISHRELHKQATHEGQAIWKQSDDYSAYLIRLKESMNQPEVKIKISQAGIGRKQSEQTKEKRRQSMIATMAKKFPLELRR